MNRSDLYNWIDSLVQDIDVQYHGRYGSICPFSRNDISITFDGKETTVHSVADAMDVPIFDGRSLNEICEEALFG